MLELKNIRKVYHVGDVETVALNDISVAFREREFVAILGTSGSGKTTCLNMIGGLDQYDSGDLVIKGKKTKDFKTNDWDAYRNNSVGFIFQSYNLIMHLSIVENVELGMTLSGVSREQKHKRAIEVLEQVGLKDHLHKKPNQLSGGQMQRVAIARALANDPEILLCDEPTGALDTATSIQIMDLIKSVAGDRLVIMVTHNPELAEEYADRIIRFQDGKIIDDTNPHIERPKEDQFHLKKTAMKFKTALGLSLNNLKTKKGRTFLTAFASSIGIIGIAVILSLSSGFKEQILQFQSDAMADMPIIISQTTQQIDEETMRKLAEDREAVMKGTAEFEDTDKVYLYNPDENTMLHTNVFNDEFMDYLKNIDKEICGSVGYTRLVGLNMVRDTENGIVPVSLSAGSSSDNMMTAMTSSATMSMGLSSYPKQLADDSQSYLEKCYDVLEGAYPANDNEVVLVIDEKNRVAQNIMTALGYDTTDVESIDLKDIVGTEIKIIPNDDYYVKTDMGNYLPGNDYEAMYKAEDAITIKISAVVRQKSTVTIGLLSTGIAYSDELAGKLIDLNKESAIVKEQESSDYNVMSMEAFIDETAKSQFLGYLGGTSIPYIIMVYPETFENKDAVLAYLDAFNEGKDSDDAIVYMDMAGTMSSMTSGIMDAITIVLVAFAAISLVVSLIMICIITYTSVLERTKEIGVLRALGARKKDITRVFDAETFILGVFSGVLGIIIAWLLTIPINSVLLDMTGLENVATLQPTHAIMLVVVSTILTVIGGHVPAKMASKKDAVEALRSE
ncbi:ABC transporter ATP-binding protein/permease [Anaerosporobacter sp.]|uniref:ABC transporter ATP-binding protein/permease n=1 Tax=Anaerosporobacter sp. TaxID=1872529 RepID=UPI00286FA0A7|nr:ATP-binding cassette domain-containing protein [Anaerosporobacter sp.]